MAWRPRVNPLDVLDPVHAVVREFDNYVGPDVLSS